VEQYYENHHLNFKNKIFTLYFFDYYNFEDGLPNVHLFFTYDEKLEDWSVASVTPA